MSALARKTLPALALAALLAGCAAPPPADWDGWYMAQRLGPDSFAVVYGGDGAATPRQAFDLLRLRAAEVTLAHGYKYFTVLDDKSVSVPFAGALAPGQKPAGTLAFQCFSSYREAGPYAHDADVVRRGVKGRYE